jgi:hypothetical protein
MLPASCALFCQATPSIHYADDGAADVPLFRHFIDEMMPLQKRLHLRYFIDLAADSRQPFQLSIFSH